MIYIFELGKLMQFSIADLFKIIIIDIKQEVVNHLSIDSRHSL
jgi:hypothetical protein